MKKRKGVAEDIKEILFNDASTEEEKDKKCKAQLIFNHIKDYYKIFDLENSTNHSKIFEYLYLLKKYLSDTEIAQRTFISVDTVRKYIVRYNRLICLLIDRNNFKL